MLEWNQEHSGPGGGVKGGVVELWLTEKEEGVGRRGFVSIVGRNLFDRPTEDWLQCPICMDGFHVRSVW